MLPIDMLNGVRHLDRTLTHLFEYSDNEGFIPMAQQLMDWKYPIGQNDHAGNMEFSALVHLPKFSRIMPLFIQMFRLSEDPPLREIWKSAVTYGDTDTMSYITPAVICMGTTEWDPFSIAMCFSYDLRTFKRAFALLPPQRTIPTGDEFDVDDKRWPGVFDFLLEKFGMDAIHDWQQRLVTEMEFGFALRLVQHFKSCSSKVCQLLSTRNDLRIVQSIEMHTKIAHFCPCGRYMNARRSSRTKKKIKIG